ncbi:THO complex subunit 1 [Desmophyllum pertusum]|uniref:THO complex subunit 1 n=1 Tax=Desmophyllum pertusum TaxID=174260 RepID=A0A9W9ZIR2_9CNID|nr:THO complex subunit 1 [Desmophyllum pertusum]
MTTKNSKLWTKVATLEQLLPIMEDLGDHWWKLGIKLKLSGAALRNINRDYRLTNEKTRAVLWEWMEHEGSDATIGLLAVAINTIGGTRTAQKLLGM